MFCTAEEFSKKFEDDMEKFHTKSPNYQWPQNAPSDHVLICGDFNGMLIVTYNLLNKKYLHHLQDSPSADRMHQRLQSHDMANPSFHETRIERHLMHLRELMRVAAVICLQEVSLEMYASLIALFKASSTMLVSCQKNGPENLNVTMYDARILELLDASHPESTNGISQRLHFRDKWHPCEFYLMNVHVSFGANPILRDQLLEFSAQCKLPVVVAGDFNVSSYQPPAGKSDNLVSVYGNSRFRFFCHAYDDPPFSAVQRFENTIEPNRKGSENGDVKRMLDRLDHVMLLPCEEN